MNDGIFHRDLRETRKTFREAGVPTALLTGHSLVTGVECYIYINLPGELITATAYTTKNMPDTNKPKKRKCPLQN
jgi:hypothetical protein